MRSFWLILISLILVFVICGQSCKKAQDEPEVTIKEEVAKEAGTLPEAQETAVKEESEKKVGVSGMEEGKGITIPVEGLKAKIKEEVKTKGEELEDKTDIEVAIPVKEEKQ